eukprot:3233835-Prymnesium_polylepis.1
MDSLFTATCAVHAHEVCVHGTERLNFLCGKTVPPRMPQRGEHALLRRESERVCGGAKPRRCPVRRS